MTCKACLNRVKTWDGDDPRCGFETNQFGDNWNCATVSLMRELCYEGRPLVAGIQYTYCSDMKYATIKVDDIDIKDRPLCLWVSWYKNRGTTDAMWLLFDNLPPRLPTEEECLAVYDYYRRTI